MAEVKIYLDLDKELDGITPDTEIALTFAEAKFNSLVSRGGTLSNRFQLAKTANNKRQLGLLDDPNSQDSRPYQLYDCRIVVDGQPTFTGLAVIEESQDYFNLRVFSGITDFFELLGDKTLQDLDLSQYDHEWTAANVNGARQNDNTQGYVYPNINYGRWTGQTLADRPYQDFYPAVYFKTLLETAATEAGYTLQNYDTNLAIPFSKQNFENNQGYFIQAIANSSNLVQTIDDTRPLGLSLTADPPNVFTTINTLPVITVRDGTIVDWNVVMELRNATNNLIEVGFGIGGGNLLSIVPIPANQSVVYTFSGQSSAGGNYGIYTKSGSATVVILNNGQNSKIEGTVTKLRIRDGNLISLSSTLPKIKLKDLFLYEAVRTNSLILTNPINKTVEFISVNSIRESRFQALDWSKKADTLTKPKTEYRLREYAQNNYLNYAEGVEEDPSFAGNNNLGRGNFEVADLALNLQRDWYEAPFAASGKSPAFTDGTQLIRIPRYSDSSLAYSEPDISPNPRVLEVSIDDTFLVDITGESSLATQANVTFEGFDENITTDYAALSAMFDKMKLVEVYVKLTAIDIQKLDITKPVYLLGAYWFIREVSQFNVTSANSTKVKLIRL